ncbi:MAG: phosphopantetheine-binding protein [Pseudomonadota bacterium]
MFGAPSQRFASIEDAICASEAVREAVVLERSDRPAGRNLLAYLCMNEGYGTSAGAARTLLAERMKPEQLPATIVTLDAMPLTPDGRLDLAALPLPDSSGLGLRQYEAPVGPLERAIAAIWQDLLGIERVGRNAHFFELGGHSSLGIQLICRLRQETKVSIALRDLFIEPTLHRFAEQVGARIPALNYAAGVRTEFAGMACAID